MFYVLAYKNRYVEPRLVGQDPVTIGDALSNLWEDITTPYDDPVADPDGKNFPLTTAGTGISRNNIVERVELGKGRIAFRSLEPWNGLHGYISADHDWLGLNPDIRERGTTVAGGLFWERLPEPGERETFREIELGGDTFAFETYKGLFVTAESDGDGSPLTINRNEIGEWQRFQYYIPPKELLPEPPAEPAEQAVGTVDKAQTTVSGIPDSPVGRVQDAQTELQRPASLRDKLFRRPGE